MLLWKRTSYFPSSYFWPARGCKRYKNVAFYHGKAKVDSLCTVSSYRFSYCCEQSKRTSGLLLKCTDIYFSILNKIAVSQQIFVSVRNNKFHENPNNGRRPNTYGLKERRTDKHDETNSGFSLFMRASQINEACLAGNGRDRFRELPLNC